MVEIGDGEVIFRGPKLEVTLLVDIEQLAAVEVRAAPGWGTTTPHVHVRHAEAVFVLEGELELQLEDRTHALERETWAFVPPGVVHCVEVGATARYVVLHAPGSGYGAYVRGDVAGFDQRPAADVVSADPGLVVVRHAGGDDDEKITDQPERRLTVLLDAEEVALTEAHYGAGQRGAPLHVHRKHADAFFVLEGEILLHLRDGSYAIPARTLAVVPPGVVHGFDVDGDLSVRYFNLHLPSLGFADYLRGRNPGFDQHDPPDDGGVDPAAALAARLSA
jgi:quercetin dioxygenase-like cupin family protein